MVAVVIADIVGSRLLADRSRAQRTLDEVIARVDEDMPLAAQTLRPTVGDELQGVYTRLEEALTSLLLVQLSLPDGLECRFGVGIGAVRTIESTAGEIPEGEGWWAARAAIDHVHALQQRAVPSARTWIVAGQEQDDSMLSIIDSSNAYLLMRDQLVGAMSERERRLTYGRCLGTTQRDLAAAEGISQSAVSQALAGAGSAAIVEAIVALRGRSVVRRKGVRA